MLKNMEKNNFKAILYCLLHSISVSFLLVLIKILSKELSTNEIVFLYKTTLLIFALPWLIKEGFKSLKTNVFLLHFLRSIFSIISALSMMKALTAIDLINITAMTYSEDIIVSLIGVIIFKESINFHKIIAITMCTIGMLLVLYPKFPEKGFDFYVINFNEGHIYLLLAVFFQSSCMILIKIIGQTENNKQQLFYLLLISVIASFFAAFLKINLKDNLEFVINFDSGLFSKLNIFNISIIATIAFLYLGHCVGIFNAFKYGEFSVVLPFDYTRMIFSGILGYIIFKETPGTYSYVGYFFILSAGILLIKNQYHSK